MRQNYVSKGPMMIRRLVPMIAVLTMALSAFPAWADEYQDTINVFRKATESEHFFRSSDGYAVFPTIGKSGRGVGCGHHRRRRRKSEHGRLIGRCERGQERRQGGRCVQQRHGDVHRGEGRTDVRGDDRWPEVQLQGALAPTRSAKQYAGRPASARPAVHAYASSSRRPGRECRAWCRVLTKAAIPGFAAPVP